VVLNENADSLTGLYAPMLIQEKLLDFIDQHKDRPFFAFVPSVIPHAELAVPDVYIDLYRDKFLPEKLYKGCDPGCDNYKSGGYASQDEAHAAFAGMIHLLDEQVGEIVRNVEKAGILDNTIIIFTSDNGPHLEGGADPDYFNSNGPLKGYKRDLYEGGIRVPMIISWPERIQAGQSSDHVSAFWDVFTTLDHLTGGNDSYGDGISFLPELLGEPQPVHEYLYWEFPERWATPAQAVIMDERWKAIRRWVENQFLEIELYDLENDPGETINLAADHPELMSRAQLLFTTEHDRSKIDDWLIEGLDITE
jgi:arylsulfatase A-like enzyme